jgi:predicted RNA-binding protein Jag
MKKFDKKAIMIRAWAIRRERGLTMSESLRAAWFEAKEGVKAYVFHMTDERKYRIENYLCKLFADMFEAVEVESKETHKFNIVGQAITTEHNGVIVTDGKTVGLLKYAVKNGAVA